jgi:hypothetical protein
MAALTIQQTALTGLEATYVACDATTAGSDTAKNASGRVILHVKNGDASDHTVTVNSIQACNQGSDHDSVTTVTASEDRFIGPFKTLRFNDASTNITITYDATTSMTIAAIELFD